MSRTSGALAALKAVPGGARYTPAPQSGGWGAISPVQANAVWQNPYSQSSYGPFLPRPSRMFTDGAFSPMSPIQPVPVDVPPPGGEFPDPRWWQPSVGWNLPTQPGSEGLKLASFDQLRTIAEKYSVARKCIELRKNEILGLEWEIQLTTQAAKAYQGDSKAMRDFGERAAEATRFFKNPDPDYWNFSSFLDAVLEEIFVYDALCLVFRPKYGKGLGRGLLGSDLDSIRLVSGPTIRPLLDMHGGKPRPPAPAYQQFLFGVPRSDYQTIIAGTDIDDYGLAGSEVNSFRADTMLYAPLLARRETPYGFPPVEQVLLPIISGLNKQNFQLDYFSEGTIPAVYISPGDANMTPTQIRELQDALNGIAGDPAYHLKVIVLPPGSKVDPQRPVDLSDGFDLLVQTQVAMGFDVMPDEIGLLPNIAGAGPSAGASSSGVRLGATATRDLKDRKSTKPLLMTLCDIVDYAIQGICGQQDMQFRFEGLQAEDDKQALVDRGVQGIQNGLYSIDEVRGWLDLPPWGLQETSEPVVFTAQGPVPFSMAPDLIRAAITGAAPPGQGTNSGQRTPSSRSRTKQPTVRAGGQTKPNGSHPAPVADHREAPLTGAHAAAAGAIQSPTPRTGGTTSRSSVAGSRKKAVEAELGALARHLRKGRLITTWVAEHIPERALGMIAEDIAKGVLIDTAVERAGDVCLADVVEHRADVRAECSKALLPAASERHADWPGSDSDSAGVVKAAHWPGWERDLGLVGAYKHLIGQAFHDAEARGSALRRKAATGAMFVSSGTLRDLIGDEVREVFSAVLTPLWTEAWHLGYAAAKSLVTGEPADFAAKEESDHLRGFIGSEEAHWLGQISRTGLGNNSARSETIARTEVARAINSAAIQCYRDHGVTHKHLLASPGACEICDDVADDGDIALDAPFSAGGVTGECHPGCRCVPAPSGVNVEPPLADLGKASGGSVKITRMLTVEDNGFTISRGKLGGEENKPLTFEDRSRAAFLMLRARHPADGKWRYLLQRRPDGDWGLPGGSTHVGEAPHAAAVRESTEEIGDLPPLGSPLAVTLHSLDDKTAWIHLHEVPFFQPANNGSTPEETTGTGWFRRGEVGDLDLHPAFREQWESADWKHIGKALQRAVNETGEVSTLTPASQRLSAVGSRWPYPHRADGSEWPDAGPGAVPDEHGSAGGEPPNRINDMAEGTHTRVYPRGGEDDKFPRRRTRNRPAARFPEQGEQDQDMWPYPQDTLQPGASSVGAPKGAHPVTGSVPAEAPQGYRPHSYEPQAFDPGLCAVCSSPEGNLIHSLPKGAGGPSDFTDPNPVHPETVYLLMSKNFPPDAIQWVKRAKWVGPVWVPWARVDQDDRDKWAASHQPEKVKEFEEQIKAHAGHVAPSILVQEPASQKAFIVDGHHRGLARENLGQQVLSYLGNVDPKDLPAARETHTKQIHSGSDPRNT